MGALDEHGWSHSTQSLTRQDIETYAAISGDRNPIHLGESGIAHGALILGKLSAMVWGRFGDGTKVIIINETKISRPIVAGEEFNVSISPAKPIVGTKHGEAQIEFRLYKWHAEKQKDIVVGSMVIIPVHDLFAS